VQTRLLLQLPDLEALVAAIDNTVEITEEDFEYVGVMVGADLDKRWFHFRPSSNADITGKFSDHISPTQKFLTGAEYHVRIRKKVKVFYSTDQVEDVSASLIFATTIRTEAQHGIEGRTEATDLPEVRSPNKETTGGSEA
jgi:hypothetical protein